MNLYKTKPRFSKQILLVPWPFVTSRFHCILLSYEKNRVYYKFNCTDPGLQLGDPAPCTHWFVAVDLLTFYIVCTREDKGDREGIPHTHPIP